MKTPKTLEEFKTLIKNAEHRERFVFDIPKEKPFYHYTECCKLEVYITHSSGDIVNHIIKNVLYQTVSILGKFDKKWNTRRSCGFHCTTEKEWQNFWSIIN